MPATYVRLIPGAGCCERLHGRRFFFKMTQDFIPFARMISKTAHYFEKVKGYLESLIQNERFRVVWFFKTQDS